MKAPYDAIKIGPPGRHRRGPVLVVLMTAALAGFIARGEFAPTVRAALGFVLAVFAVTFLVSLAHAIWGEKEAHPPAHDELAESEPPETRPDFP